MAKRTSVIGRLEDHPNLDGVLGVLAQLAHISDDEVAQLAEGWHNSASVASARAAALSPDSPLVVEVLAAFDALGALFDDDLRAEAAWVTVDPATTTTALKAVRDAIAGAYARPVLSPAAHDALLRPWRRVYPVARVAEPDLGPRADDVKALLGALPALSARCHDPAAEQLFGELVDRSFAGEGDRAEARSAAFDVAVLTSRRRVWALVRRSGAEGLSRACPTCPRPPAVSEDQVREAQRVMGLCLDAACALLVADALPDAALAVLVEPVTSLVPQQRRPSA